MVARRPATVGFIVLLSGPDLDDALAGAPAWSVSEGHAAIRRTVKFKDFATAFGFMTAVALEAQALDHHPDWSNSWATVELSLSTHSAGGLTALDFELAARIDRHAAAAGGTAT